MKAILCLVLVLLAANFSSSAIARDNKTKKWEEVPEAVRKTILANGGGAGPVDREDQKIGGKVVYEAPGKDKQGKEVDLVVAEDGTLVKTKDDDAVDRKKEIAALSRKALIKIKFTHPREIDHPFLPLASVKQDILEGSEGGKKVRIERTVMPGTAQEFQDRQADDRGAGGRRSGVHGGERSRKWRLIILRNQTTARFITSGKT